MTLPPAPSATHHATIVAARPLTPHMTRLTLAAPSFDDMEPRPAQDVEVLLADDTGRRLKRRYTIRHHRPETGEIDLDVFVHHHGGPGSTWARTAQPGTAVDLIGPKGKLQLRPAGWHLFVGDEASLPAIAALSEALGNRQTRIAVIEVTDQSDHLPLDGTEVHWLHRHATPPGTTRLLDQQLRAFTPPNHGAGQAYLLGESRAMIALRPLLGQHHIDAEHTFLKGYWNRQRPGGGSTSAPRVPRSSP
jgi:NADPH-dependent ferric siderophore reductase